MTKWTEELDTSAAPCVAVRRRIHQPVIGVAAARSPGAPAGAGRADAWPRPEPGLTKKPPKCERILPRSRAKILGSPHPGSRASRCLRGRNRNRTRTQMDAAGELAAASFGEVLRGVSEQEIGEFTKASRSASRERMQEFDRSARGVLDNLAVSAEASLERFRLQMVSQLEQSIARRTKRAGGGIRFNAGWVWQ